MYNYRMSMVPTGTFSQAALNAFLHDRKVSEPFTKNEFKCIDNWEPEDPDGGDDGTDRGLI